ncbi:molecular chaperone GrpE [Lachnospiraceae bacterium XBB1006]|nr:molecular chaperone GrpE [Lachnospiraceae bacterium XBB1006]
MAKKEREENLSEETVEETVEETCQEETPTTDEVSEETSEEEAEQKDKKDKKDKKDEKIAELTDKVTRQMAEFDNFRKRTEKEKGQMFDMGAKSIVEKILPVVDNFERGLSSVPEDLKENPFVDGMDKIYKQMLASLEEAGVTAIEALDKEFDPNLHNAVMHVDDENYGENVVIEEFQKGYCYHDTVVRHSMVKVAN